MAIVVSVEQDKENIQYICDRCKQEGLSEDQIIRLTAKQGIAEIDVWDLCPDCYSEVMDGAISPHLES